MTNEEIEKYIYVEIMGNPCVHKRQKRIEYPPIAPGRGSSGWDMKCEDCGTVRVSIPKYCSDDSPRRLLNEVVETVVDTMGTPFPYNDALAEQTRNVPRRATAAQIARACVEAHKLTAKSAA